ncbi:MAG: hypothetical protein IME99_07050 [Proteobacteria bacterium]|nr:hypothetical protein [Pseudomonadota bacterium]
MVSDVEKAAVLLAEVTELSTRQLEHFEANRIVEMLQCQQDRTVVFNSLVELPLADFASDPRVKSLIEKVLAQDKVLSLNVESTVEEHKQKIASLQLGTIALKAYSGG